MYYIVKLKINKMNKTKKILDQYVSDILEKKHYSSNFVSYKLHVAFGGTIHGQIERFVKFCKENDIDRHDIRATLIHYINGALHNDYDMIPRVSTF